MDAHVRSRESAWLWLAKIISGVLIFVVLIIHLVVNHLVAEGGLLSYTDVLAYYRNPLIPLMEGFFLALVVPHALLGVRGIVLDVAPAAATMRVVDGLLWLIGGVALTYGFWLLLTVAGVAALS